MARMLSLVASSSCGVVITRAVGITAAFIVDGPTEAVAIPLEQVRREPRAPVRDAIAGVVMASSKVFTDFLAAYAVALTATAEGTA